MENSKLICGCIYKVVSKPGTWNNLNESCTWCMKFSHIDDCGWICCDGSFIFNANDNNIVEYIIPDPGQLIHLFEVESITKIDDPLILETFEYILNKYGENDVDFITYWDKESNEVRNLNKKNNMKKIYKFGQDWCYGYLYGIFVADEKDVEFLINSDIVFNAGEVLGKYSECTSEVSSSDIKEVSSDKEFIDNFKKYKAETGYNPLYFYLYPYEMNEQLCPDCGIEWSDITVLDYIYLVRDRKLPDGYNLEDLDMNVIIRLFDFYKNEMESWK